MYPPSSTAYEKYETANWSLRQGDEEGRSKQKNKTKKYTLKQIAQYFG